MIESSYWFDEAAKFKEQAKAVEDAGEQDEFLELAEICIEIAIRVEERATGG
jgi:hypothetical protein